MAAYAALVSVMQILDQIRASSPPPFSIDNSQLQSLTQKLAFLQEFLEGYSSHVGYTEEADPMASRIAAAAYAAEDVIESYIVDQILARSTNYDEEISSIEFYQSLQTVIEKMELIEVEAVEIKQKKGVRDQLHTIKSATHAGSSVRAAPETLVKSLEEAGNEYLEELVDRNLILVEERNHCGKLKSFKIHDLLLDLCLREAQKVKFLCVLEEQSILQDLDTQRHILGTLSEYPTQVLQSLGNASLVRSMYGNFPKTLLSNFRMLRIPLFDDKESGEHCEEVFLGLVNLRLAVVGVDPFPRRIPSSISFFWNLQTLILMECRCILEIWKLPQLRHVRADGGAELCLPCPTNGEDIVVLRNLHTLSIVTNLICGEDVVSRVPNIKELKLYYDEEFMEASPGLNNLRHLHKLETLAISLDFSCDSCLVHNLTFPQSLKCLKLIKTKLQWEDMNTKIGPLPILQVLELEWNSFTESEWETLEGQFRSLKFLKISGCDLEQWVTDNTHFPRLQHLVLRNMRGLREIPSSVGDIPTLRSIELNNCSESAVDSAKRIQEEQEDYGNTDLKLIIQG